MINSDNHGWITVYRLSACFLPFEKSERCAYKRPTVLNIDSLSQFVLRKYTNQEITVRDKHPDIFRKYWSQASLICFYTQTANRVWVLPDVIPCAHPEFRLWKTEVRKVKKTKQKTAYPSMAAQCLVSVFTACAKITIRAVQEEISCHLERMSDSLLTDLFI